MANNMQEASFMFDAGTAEQAALIVKWIGGEDIPAELKAKMQEASHDCFDEVDGTLVYTIADAHVEDASKVWVHLDDGDIELLVQVLDYAMQAVPGVQEKCGFAWAYWCSKPRIEEFGGGAAFMQKGQDPKWLGTSSWLEEQMKR